MFILVNNIDEKYPALEDLRRASRRRLPHFAFEYLDSATGPDELGKARNRAALDGILFRPDILKGPLEITLETNFLGHHFFYPFGIAPIGMSGLIWPDSERILAQEAVRAGIPYCLSTVATRLPEEVGPFVGENGWFQLYMPADATIRRDILRRAKESGFGTLIVTLDVPADCRRERQRRAQLSIPLQITPHMLYETLTHPRWMLGMLKHGKPHLKLPESYLDPRQKSRAAYAHAGHIIRGYPDWHDMETLRLEWDGPLIAKGITDPDAAKRLIEIGVDAIWVSNHAARQFEGAPGAISALPEIRAALGTEAKIIYDSGVRSGLDVMRALALGADFVFLGQAWHYALGALGKAGPPHLSYILSEDMRANMAQIGARNITEIQSRLSDA